MEENKNALTEEELEQVSGGSFNRVPDTSSGPSFSAYENDGNCGNSVRVKNGKCQETLCGTAGDEHICKSCKYAN